MLKRTILFFSVVFLAACNFMDVDEYRDDKPAAGSFAVKLRIDGKEVEPAASSGARTIMPDVPSAEYSFFLNITRGGISIITNKPIDSGVAVFYDSDVYAPTAGDVFYIECKNNSDGKIIGKGWAALSSAMIQNNSITVDVFTLTEGTGDIDLTIRFYNNFSGPLQKIERVDSALYNSFDNYQRNISLYSSISTIPEPSEGYSEIQFAKSQVAAGAYFFKMTFYRKDGSTAKTQFESIIVRGNLVSGKWVNPSDGSLVDKLTFWETDFDFSNAILTLSDLTPDATDPFLYHSSSSLSNYTISFSGIQGQDITAEYFHNGIETPLSISSNAVTINAGTAGFYLVVIAVTARDGVTKNTFRVEVSSESIPNIYVSASGNDNTGNGQIDNPYKTVDKALIVMNGAGQSVARINISGALTEAVTIPNGKKLLFQGYGGGGVIQSNGDVFTVQAGADVLLGSGLTLKMNGGSGTVVKNRGCFTMNGGVITGGRVIDAGAGVDVISNAQFVMTGGVIMNNSASPTSKGTGAGGVFVHGGTISNTKFIFMGGVIKNNTTAAGSTVVGGGGILISNAEFKMSGSAAITNNTGYYGGGLYALNSNVTITGGVIENNDGYEGGGINVSNLIAPNTIANCIIRNNTSQTFGGGMSLYSSSVAFSSVVFSGNAASEGGGGLYIKFGSNASFTSGLISGNTVVSASGAGVMVSSSAGNESTLKLDSERVQIAFNDDIYLSDNSKIIASFAPASPLESFYRITPQTYNTGVMVLTSNSNTAAYKKFMVTPSGGNYWAVSSEKALFPAVATRTQGADVLAYADLRDAFAMADGTSAAPDVITVLSDIDMAAESNISILAAKHIKLVSATGPARVLKRAGNTGDLFTVNGQLVLENIIVDGGAVWVGGANPPFPAFGVSNTGITVSARLIHVSGSSAKLTLLNGAILQNNANTGNGGAVLLESGAEAVIGGTGAEIRYNQASSGGGIAMASSTKLTLTNGSIHNNNAGSDGGGVYMGGGSLTMSGSARVAGNNDVYLANGKTITIDRTLTAAVPVATITPAEYNTGISVLSGVTNQITGNYLRLAVTPSDGTAWYIDSSGCLTMEAPQ
ncbi:MAG: hypothetical protein LBD07_01065 [Spirochaetaceae bacterium]|nr:hypothetical protein [Spirochaetaceae bacterium]